MTTVNLNIGAPVYCKGRHCGTLRKVVLDHQNERITDLIIERGALHKTSRVVPVALASDTSGESIRLSINEEELESYPEYDESEQQEDASGASPNSRLNHEWAWYDSYGKHWTDSLRPRIRVVVQSDAHVPPVEIERGLAVTHADTKLGAVDHILVNAETQSVMYLIIRSGIFPTYRIVPADAIEDVQENKIALSLGEDDIETLSRYTPRSDDEIIADIEQRLQSERDNFGEVQVRVADAIAYLTGNVSSIAAKRRAEAIACSTKGVIDVVNELEADSTVSARVVSALHEAPATRLALIDVAVDQGTATLRGRVDTRGIKAMAESIARAQTGVLEVSNRLSVDTDTDTTALLERTSDAHYQLEHSLPG